MRIAEVLCACKTAFISLQDKCANDCKASNIVKRFAIPKSDDEVTELGLQRKFKHTPNTVWRSGRSGAAIYIETQLWRASILLRTSVQSITKAQYWMSQFVPEVRMKYGMEYP